MTASLGRPSRPHEHQGGLAVNNLLFDECQDVGVVKYPVFGIKTGHR